MIYIVIISLLIEKPFYLLRPQNFSFQIVSEFKDTFVKFSNFMSEGWGFWLPVLSRREGFCTQWLSRGEGFSAFKSCPGGDGFRWNWYLHKRYWLQKLLSRTGESLSPLTWCADLFFRAVHSFFLECSLCNYRPQLSPPPPPKIECLKMIIAILNGNKIGFWFLTIVAHLIGKLIHNK